MINKEFILFVAILFSVFNCIIAQTNIGLFDNHLDIGEVKNQGFASYSEGDQIYTLGGSGKNMWFDNDEFHYLWTTMQGDFIVRAEIEFLGSGVDPHRKAGWIIKNDLNAETPHVNATVHGDGLTSLQYRTTAGGDTDEVVSIDSLPSVIQLERRGNEFIMSTSTFGAPFVEVKTINTGINNQVYVGLYVCSHNPDVLEVAKFRNVRIIRPAPLDFKPYSDYIGSHLEVMEVATGHRMILHSNSNSIQAPNWTPDGAFDGSLIGISHHNAEDNNQSTLYYLPVEGDSLPVKITPNGAGNSYLHGWSPDNKKMLFTGHRKGQYDIYSVDVESGKEEQLTNQKTLDDGSLVSTCKS